MIQSVQGRFLNLVSPEPNTGCWLWLGSCSPKGYGGFTVSTGNTRPAHRVAYEMFKGPIPAGMTLDHQCRTRACVNPDHLEPVTNAENIRRGMVGEYNRVKTHCPQGHPYDEANTQVYLTRTDRMCRECKRADYRRRYAEHKAAGIPMHKPKEKN